MDETAHAQTITYEDTWLLGGARTPFADFNGTLREVSATDLGIKAAREALAATKTDARPDRRGGGGLGGADELRRVLSRPPHRPVCRPADRRAGAGGAAAVHLRFRGDPAGGRPDRSGQVGSGAVRRHRIHVAQPHRRLHPPRRLQDGPGGVQGLPVGGDAGHGAEVAHGRYGRGAGQALPDHARGYRRVRRHQLRSRGEGARSWLLHRRDRARRGRAVRARGIRDARASACRAGSSRWRPTSIRAPRRWRR